jgi:hypothetical protein
VLVDVRAIGHRYYSLPPPETRATAQPIPLPTPPKRMQPCNRLDSRLPRSCRAPLMVKGQREGSHLTVAGSRGKIHYEDDRQRDDNAKTNALHSHGRVSTDMGLLLVLW